MKFESAAGANPLDQGKVLGRATDRIEGKLKTTGTARYAYEWHEEVPKAAYGYVIGSAIAKGRIVSIDVHGAKTAPGVIGVITAAEAGPLTKAALNTAHLLGGPDIQHYHQAIAVVVAETFEQARTAAQRVQTKYAKAPGAFDLAAAKDGAAPAKIFGRPGESATGDFAGAFAAAPVQFDATYTTPDHAHVMMEPHASIAAWNGDKLTMWTSNQMIDWAVRDMASTLGIARENIRIVSPYVGGGFGGKLFLRADALLAALAARATGRPVKIALQRPLMINNTVHRPATIQRIRFGATPDGKLTALAHEGWAGDLPGGKAEASTRPGRLMYAAANRMTALKLAVLDLPEGNAMRAPGDTPGQMALEVAIDEMAEKLKLDPIEFRILNDTQVDPESPSRPFSQRKLTECLRTGADKFGWQRRQAPGKVRENEWLIGMGVAGAIRDSPVVKSGARVKLDNRGMVIVESDMTDIGTGSYTIMGQTAAEMMGVSLDRVVVRLGDSAFPVASGSGGQWGANCSTAGVYAACVKLRETVAQKLGVDPAMAEFIDGQVREGKRSVSLAQAARDGELAAEDAIEFGDLDDKNRLFSFGAHFVEVAVRAFTGETRVRRMLAVCSAGRILNPKSARSQIIGAMTMGVGAALMEELAVDKRHGFFVNHDLASYEVPVHGDIPHQEVIFLDEVDPLSSPMKARGLGELGLCGVPAAIANAIYNATGIRVRDYPITLDKLIRGLPA
ncbi:MAG TPA: aldehyde oxidoreductase molybdenum-binding subunit PaoC [Steroidobacteraceae bacterium]|nr:aldehyde oxidoreductase molybdenum-binding subunit PaoC [Steroidobacteraceae bacterium]